MLQNRCDDAIRLSREVLTHRGRSLTDSHPAVAASLQVLGRCLDRRGDVVEGGKALEESLDIRRKVIQAGHWLIATSESIYGEHLTRIGRYREAEPLLLRSYETLQGKLGDKHDRTQDALRRLVHLYEKSHQPILAERYRAKLPH